MILSVLGSGSKGNSTYIASGSTAILVDAGLSYSQIKKRAEQKELNLDFVKGILITHNHSDHRGNADYIAQKLDAEIVYSSDIGTFSAKCKGSLYFEFLPLVHDIHTFAVYITDTGAYGQSVCIATDTGVVPFEVIDKCSGCDIVILESNHDRDMLLSGPYPQHLIDRIDSDRGHLSNKDAAEAILKMLSSKTKHIILSHISSQNNSLAKIDEALKYVIANASPLVRKVPMFHVATQDKGSAVFKI